MLDATLSCQAAAADAAASAANGDEGVGSSAGGEKNFLHQRPKKTRLRPTTSPAVGRPPLQQPPHQQHQQHRRSEGVLQPLQALRRLESRLSIADIRAQAPVIDLNLREKARGLRFCRADYSGWEREGRHEPAIESNSVQDPRSDSELAQPEEPQAPQQPPPPTRQPPPPALQSGLRLIVRCRTACKTCFIPLLREPRPGPPQPPPNPTLPSPPSPAQSYVGNNARVRFRRPFPLPSCSVFGSD